MRTRYAITLAPLACALLAAIGPRADADIIYPRAPAGGREIVVRALGEIRQLHGEIANTPFEDLTIEQPHRWYSVGAADLAAGRFLSAATSSSWRYILTANGNSAGVVQLADPSPKTGNRLKFTGFYDIGFGQETLNAIHGADQLPRVRSDQYEVRFLEAPALAFSALWLHAKSDDIIIPLPSPFNGLTPYQPYSEREVLQALKPAAKTVLRSPGLER